MHPPYNGHLPIADTSAWSRGVRNSEVPLYMCLFQEKIFSMFRDLFKAAAAVPPPAGLAPFNQVVFMPMYIMFAIITSPVAIYSSAVMR